MQRQAVALDKAYLLMNHGPVTLVSTAHGERRNVMAASWAMPLDFSPPKVAVVVDRTTLTRELIEASGHFTLNIPCRAIAGQVLAVGSCTGREVDKFATLGIATTPGSVGDAPLIDGCVAWLECRVISEPHNEQRYDLFLGEVLAAWADPRVFADGRWRFDDDALRTIHYLAGGTFLASGDPFTVAGE